MIKRSWPPFYSPLKVAKNLNIKMKPTATLGDWRRHKNIIIDKVPVPSLLEDAKVDYFEDENALKTFFKKYLLKNITNNELLEKAINYLMITMNQAGLLFPVSDAVTMAFLEATGGSLVPNGSETVVDFVTTESGFKIQETCLVRRLLDTEKDSGKEDNNNLPFLEAHITINFNFLEGQDKRLTIESRSIGYGNERIRKLLNEIFPQAVDYIKIIGLTADIEQLSKELAQLKSERDKLNALGNRLLLIIKNILSVYQKQLKNIKKEFDNASKEQERLSRETICKDESIPIDKEIVDGEETVFDLYNQFKVAKARSAKLARFKIRLNLKIYKENHSIKIAEHISETNTHGLALLEEFKYSNKAEMKEQLKKWNSERTKLINDNRTLINEATKLYDQIEHKDQEKKILEKILELSRNPHEILTKMVNSFKAEIRRLQDEKGKFKNTPDNVKLGIMDAERIIERIFPQSDVRIAGLENESKYESKSLDAVPLHPQALEKCYQLCGLFHHIISKISPGRFQVNLEQIVEGTCLDLSDCQAAKEALYKENNWEHYSIDQLGYLEALRNLKNALKPFNEALISSKEKAEFYKHATALIEIKPDGTNTHAYLTSIYETLTTLINDGHKDPQNRLIYIKELEKLSTQIQSEQPENAMRNFGKASVILGCLSIVIGIVAKVLSLGALAPISNTLVVGGGAAVLAGSGFYSQGKKKNSEQVGTSRKIVEAKESFAKVPASLFSGIEQRNKELKEEKAKASKLLLTS